MKPNWPIYVFLICSCFCFGQQGVSGYSSFKGVDQDSEIYLTKLVEKKGSKEDSIVVLAKTPIASDGFFSFDQELFSEENTIYQLRKMGISEEEKKQLKKTLVGYRSLIHAKKDSAVFRLSEHPFGHYMTTNSADQEWQRLQDFESKLDSTETVENLEQYLLQTRGFIKDSLKVLLVKLLGIKRLEEKQLLHDDIKAHSAYYVDLLKEFQDSELAPSTYAPFERAVMDIEQAQLQGKYSISLGLNILGILLVIGLSVIVFNYRKKKDKPVFLELSRQEKTIKALILDGKSNKEIANELFISISTVKTHISNIYSKLRVSSRGELQLKE